MGESPRSSPPMPPSALTIPTFKGFTFTVWTATRFRAGLLRAPCPELRFDELDDFRHLGIGPMHDQ